MIVTSAIVMTSAFSTRTPDRGETTRSPRRRSGCGGACRGGLGDLAFSMAFQPVVDIRERRIDAYEALVRGTAGEGAKHVLDRLTPGNLYAFDQASRVRAIEMAVRLGIDRQLNINFLPNAVYEPRACIQATLDAAARTGFPLDKLTFEIVESETIVEPDRLRDIIVEYRRHGFRIALDDFTTGYSGLSRLIELRPDIVKIDRVLVQGCHVDRTRLAVIAGLLRICDEIGIKAVLEGIECLEEALALRSAGARFLQGFHFAMPAFERVVRDTDISWPS